MQKQNPSSNSDREVNAYDDALFVAFFCRLVGKNIRPVKLGAGLNSPFGRNLRQESTVGFVDAAGVRFAPLTVISGGFVRPMPSWHRH